MKIFSLENLFSQAPVAICIVSGAQYNVEFVNERMLTFLGRTQAIIGHPLSDTLTEIKEQGLLKILDRVRSTAKPYSIEDFPSDIFINGVRERRYFNLIFKPYFFDDEAVPEGVFCVAHNITSQVLAIQGLEEEKRRTMLALETGDFGVLSTDWEANTATVDKRAAEIFGLEGNQSLADFVSRIHPDDRYLREEAIQQSRTSGSADFEMRLQLPDGNIKWIRSKSIAQKNSDGKITGTFGIVQDITPQKEFALALHKKVDERTAELAAVNESLLQVNQQLLQSNQNLEEFARAASHDLKEPVRKIQVFASRLGDVLHGRLSSEEAAMFARLQHSAERMGLLVDDLLEYSQLSQSDKQIEIIDLNEKMSRILGDLELLIKEKDAQVTIGNLPQIKGHRRQLQQLFQNLLINALKYSRPSIAPRITINAKRIERGDVPIELPLAEQAKSFHLIEVCDNGIGFDQAEAERIFLVFTRLHGMKEFPGAGIGLSIAKRVMENHNGYIYAEGKVNKGACFRMLFPVEE